VFFLTAKNLNGPLNQVLGCSPGFVVLFQCCWALKRRDCSDLHFAIPGKESSFDWCTLKHRVVLFAMQVAFSLFIYAVG